MLDSTQVSVTEDPDPLPPGFYVEPSRRCEFFHEDRTHGLKGLAFAVILRALEDGVNERWLRMLASFYEVEIPDRLLRRPPQRRLRMSACTGRIGNASIKIVLTWFDAMPIQERHLVA